MKISFSTVFIILILVLLFGATSASADLFDVVKYGAVGDGVADDTQAFIDAWGRACGSSGNPTMYMPPGKRFLTRSMVFKGPCNSNINMNINGTIVAPNDLSQFDYDDDGRSEKWIQFSDVDGISLDGFGTIDGQGSPWWERPCTKNKECPKSPTSLVINHCKNVNIKNLHFVDSPQMHLAFESSTIVNVDNIFIKAPMDSPNTDGIHVQGSRNIEISNCQIGTGDDCISIGPGSSNINITSITCGPGHGISIGSLGEKDKYDTVEYIYVKDSQLQGTSNGARIKTRPGGRGYARNIVFESLHVYDVKYPIIIDQNYSANKRDHLEGTSTVSVSDITFNSIIGTTMSENAVTFNCSDVVPCTGIKVNNIHILPTSNAPTSNGGHALVHCSNAQGISTGQVDPPIPCLAAS